MIAPCPDVFWGRDALVAFYPPTATEAAVVPVIVAAGRRRTYQLPFTPAWKMTP